MILYDTIQYWSILVITWQRELPWSVFIMTYHDNIMTVSWLNQHRITWKFHCLCGSQPWRLKTALQTPSKAPEELPKQDLKHSSGESERNRKSSFRRREGQLSSRTKDLYTIVSVYMCLSSLLTIHRNSTGLSLVRLPLCTVPPSPRLLRKSSRGLWVLKATVSMVASHCS